RSSLPTSLSFVCRRSVGLDGGHLALRGALPICSFAGAAAALDMTPSGVSRAVARLETRLGVRLFDRNPRSVSATERGLRSKSLTDRKSTRLNSSHRTRSYAVFCLKKKKDKNQSI